MELKKSDQWKAGHRIVNLLDSLLPDLLPDQRRVRAVTALKCLYSTAPWEYTWTEVIDSVLEQKKRRLAKKTG